MDRAALEAARARARGGLIDLAAAGQVALALDGPVWRVVRRQDRGRQVALLTCPPEHAPVVEDDSVSGLSPTRAKVLLGVLAATRVDGAAHPWPGLDTTVREVLRLLGGARVSEGSRRHYLGSFRDLVAVGLVEIPGHDPELVVDESEIVRVGPAVAAWDGPWLDEIATLAGEVVAEGGRGVLEP
jgi:hypothetical protein